MTLVLALGAFVLSAAAVLGAVVALRRTRPVPLSRDAASLPPDVLGLRQEVAALRAEGAEALRHLSVVRYDALDDLGGRLSWSVALLDDTGNGLVLTSIHGRSEARTYAKQVAAWAATQQLSPEEEQAIAHARPR